MNEKSIWLKIKREQENEIRIYNHICFIGREYIGVLQKSLWF